MSFSNPFKAVREEGAYGDISVKMRLKSAVDRAISKRRNAHEKIGVQGLVTVVKNKGKPTEEYICYKSPNVLTTVGRSAFHDVLYDTTTGFTPFRWIALSNDNTAETASDADGGAALAGERTGNGLGRKNATTVSESGGTTTISAQFSATGTESDIRKSALFNSAHGTSGTTFAHVKRFNEVDLVNGDTLTITWTITLS